MNTLISLLLPLLLSSAALADTYVYHCTILKKDTNGYNFQLPEYYKQKYTLTVSESEMSFADESGKTAKGVLDKTPPFEIQESAPYDVDSTLAAIPGDYYFVPLSLRAGGKSLNNGGKGGFIRVYSEENGSGEEFSSSKTYYRLDGDMICVREE